MNLETLGVREMKPCELVITDGGDWIEAAAWWMSTSARAAQALIDGFQDGANAVVNAHNEMYH